MSNYRAILEAFCDGLIVHSAAIAMATPEKAEAVAETLAVWSMAREALNELDEESLFSILKAGHLSDRLVDPLDIN